MSARHALQSAWIAPRPKPMCPAGLHVCDYLLFCRKVLVRREKLAKVRKFDKHTYTYIPSKNGARPPGYSSSSGPSTVPVEHCRLPDVMPVESLSICYRWDFTNMAHSARSSAGCGYSAGILGWRIPAPWSTLHCTQSVSLSVCLSVCLSVRLSSRLVVLRVTGYIITDCETCNAPVSTNPEPIRDKKRASFI